MLKIKQLSKMGTETNACVYLRATDIRYVVVLPCEPTANGYGIVKVVDYKGEEFHLDGQDPVNADLIQYMKKELLTFKGDDDDLDAVN